MNSRDVGRSRLVSWRNPRATAASDWPIARDVVDYLGEEPLEDDEEEGEPIGDLGIVADLGLLDTYTGLVMPLIASATGTLTVTVPANVEQRDAYVTDLLPDGLTFIGYDSATCTSG